MLIYEPKGRALEYSPFALNVYTNCDHNCTYCYVQTMAKKFGRNHFGEVRERKNFLKMLEKEAIKHKENKNGEWVFLCFTTDPYCHKDVEAKVTREVLKILLKNNIQVSILSKGGKRILRDLDLFKEFGENIKVGATLTFDNDKQSLGYEPGAAPYSERIEVLKTLKENNIPTFASFEPVISTKQSLNIIKNNYRYIDWFKIGVLNHFKDIFIEEEMGLKEFGEKSVLFLRENNKNIFIKHDLRKQLDDGFLTKEEVNPYQYYNKNKQAKLTLF